MEEKELLDNEKTTKSPKNTKKIIKNTIVTTLVGSVFLGIGFSYGKHVGRQLPVNYKVYNDNKIIGLVCPRLQHNVDYVLNRRFGRLFYNISRILSSFFRCSAPVDMI